MVSTSKLPNPTTRSWPGLFFALGGWVCLILAGLTLMMTIAGVVSQNEAKAFDDEGVEVTALIVDKNIKKTTRRTSEGTRTDTDYFVRFRYQAGGEELQTRKQVSQGFYNDATRGAQLQIRYLRSEPNRIEEYVGAARDDANTALIIQGLGGAGALGTLWWFGSRTNRAVRTRRDGREVGAEIVEIKDVSRRRKFGQLRKHRYGRVVWRDDEGKTGESLRYTMNRLTGLAKGQRTVVYRLGDEAWWQGDVGPRA